MTELVVWSIIDALLAVAVNQLAPDQSTRRRTTAFLALAVALSMAAAR